MSLASKLLEVQRELADKVHFDSTNPHFKNEYVSLPALLKLVQPLLWERGILVMQPLTHIDGKPAITTRFSYIEDEEEMGRFSPIIEYTVPLVLEKDSPQAAGSAITYFRRYALLSALGLVGDADDDAEEATWEKSPAPAARQRPAF